MKTIKLNSIIFVIYIYITSITLLISPIGDSFTTRMVLSILLIIITLFFNKFLISKKVLLLYGLLVLLISINVISVDYKSFVINNGLIFIVYSFIPIYLLTQRKVSFAYMKIYWIKLSYLFTLLLPIYYIYRQKNLISYYDIGFVTHLNIMIMTYVLVNGKRFKIHLILFLIINFGVLTILGSRMVLVATLVTALVIYIFLSNRKRGLGFYISLLIISITVYLTNLNLIKILLFINEKVSDLGIKSRNLSMFINQLTYKSDNSVILSGRDEIYPVVYTYLIENGFFPSGLGITHHLTNGEYYHSHNFILEMFLIFGVIGTVGFLVVFLVKVISLFRRRYFIKEKILFDFLIIFLSSFSIRSMTGTYFLTDSIFLVCLAMIISINFKNLQYSN